MTCLGWSNNSIKKSAKKSNISHLHLLCFYKISFLGGQTLKVNIVSQRLIIHILFCLGIRKALIIY